MALKPSRLLIYSCILTSSTHFTLTRQERGSYKKLLDYESPFLTIETIILIAFLH